MVPAQVRPLRAYQITCLHAYRAPHRSAAPHQTPKNTPHMFLYWHSSLVCAGISEFARHLPSSPLHCFTCPQLIIVVHLLMRRSSAGVKLLRLLPALVLQIFQHAHHPLLTSIPSRMGGTSGNCTGTNFACLCFALNSIHLAGINGLGAGGSAL